MKNKLVKEGYNKIASDYSATRDRFKNIKYLEKLNSLLKPNSTILDIGCGAGVPVDKYFVDHGHKIVGINISEKQIEMAKKNLPNEKFEVHDMSELKDGEFKIDAIVSFYAIFHIPKEEHEEIFNKINSFLKIGGLILVTMGASDWEGTEDFHGSKMFWSHFGPEKNSEIVKKTGFEILESEIQETGDEKHQIILARKTK